MFDIFPQLLINSLITGSIYALASAGLSLTYGQVRVLNFAHGHIMMLGAYLFLWAIGVGPLGGLAHGLELSKFAAAIFVLGSGLILALLTWQIFLLPFHHLSPLLPLITTLCLGVILESVVALYFGVNVQSLSRLTTESFQFFGAYITELQILIIASAVIVLGFLATLIHLTPLGRRIQAVGHSSNVASALGLSRSRTTFFVYALGLLLAMYAGILVGYDTNLQPTMGNSFTIKAFAAMILGGLGNMWGTVVGAFLLGLIENFSIGIDIGGYSLPAGYKDAFAFFIILLVLLFKPQGLFGGRHRQV